MKCSESLNNWQRLCLFWTMRITDFFEYLWILCMQLYAFGLQEKKILQVAFTAFCHRKVLDWIKQSVWSTYYDCLIFNRNDLSHTVPGKQWKKNMPRLGVLNVFDWARWLCYRAFDAIYYFLCELIFKSIRFAFCAYRTMWIWELMNRPPKNSTPPCKYFGGFLKHDGFRWNIMWAKE